MTNFEGYTVNVGMDQHVDSHNYSIFLENQHAETFQTDRIDVGFIYNKLKDQYPNAKYRLCHEAGYCGYEMSRQFQALGMEVYVINPADVPATHKDKVQKRDNRDAKRLAQVLISGVVKRNFIPSGKQEADRDLVRQRTGVIRKSITGAQQRISVFLIRKGIYDRKVYEGKTRWTIAYGKWLKSLKFKEQSDRLALDSLIMEWEQGKERKKRIDRHILALSKTADYAKNMELLTSIPGIGRLSAMVLLTEIIDISRFESDDQLRSFLGLIPDVSCSNKKEKVSGLTIRCNKELRRVIIQCAWVGKNRVPKWSKRYLEMTKNGKVPQQAIVRVARSMINTVRALLVRQEGFDPTK